MCLAEDAQAIFSTALSEFVDARIQACLASIPSAETLP